jgi:hypothetical protein
MKKIYKHLIFVFLIVASLGDLKAQGSCASPDGVIKEISGYPFNFQELEDNEYCIYSNNSTNTINVCFYFNNLYEDININLGYKSSCVNTSFSNFNLYNKDCIFIDNGLSFNNLNINENYTWCFQARAWGGPSCIGFEDICPYFMDNGISLFLNEIEISCENNLIKWKTNSNFIEYFNIYILKNNNWTILDKIDFNINQNEYEFLDINCLNKNYYKIEAIDLNNNKDEFPTITCNCENEENLNIINIYNIIGQKVDINSKGLIIIQKENNKYIKKINF